MKCPNCKKEIENGSAFCEHCGTRIKKSKKGLWITLSVIFMAVIITIVGMTIQEQMIIERNCVEQHQLELEQQLQAEREARQEAERQAEAERKAREEAERQAEAERKARAEAERNAEAERKARAEAERNAKHLMPTTPKETLIYAQSKYENKRCGTYNGELEYFSANLASLNREHFRIDFVFDPSRVERREQSVLVLSKGWRILEIRINSDGKIYLVTNNMRNRYATGLTYVLDDNRIILEYNKGSVWLSIYKNYGTKYTSKEETKLDIVMEEYNGDNQLASQNCGDARVDPFRGYINSVRVYNIK